MVDSMENPQLMEKNESTGISKQTYPIFGINEREYQITMLNLIFRLCNYIDPEEGNKLGMEINLSYRDIRRFFADKRHYTKSRIRLNKFDLCHAALEKKFSVSQDCSNKRAMLLARILNLELKINLKPEHILLWFEWKLYYLNKGDHNLQSTVGPVSNNSSYKVTKKRPIMKKQLVAKKQPNIVKRVLRKNKNNQLRDNLANCITKKNKSRQMKYDRLWVLNLVFRLSSTLSLEERTELCKDLNCSFKGVGSWFRTKYRQSKENGVIRERQNLYNMCHTLLEEKFKTLQNITDREAEILTEEVNESTGINTNPKHILLWYKWKHYFVNKNLKDVSEEHKIQKIDSSLKKYADNNRKYSTFVAHRPLLQTQNSKPRHSRALLEEEFQKNNYLTVESRLQLSKELRLTEIEIANWFKNRKQLEIRKINEGLHLSNGGVS